MTLACFLNAHSLKCGASSNVAPPVCVGAMAIRMEDNSLELSMDVSSSNGECDLSSPSAGSIDETDVFGFSQYTSSHESFEGHE